MYLAFLTEDGELEKVYGSDLHFNNSDGAIKALNKNGSLIEQGIDDAGEKVLLFGKAVACPMSGGRKSAGLVAGIEMETLNQELFWILTIHRFILILSTKRENLLLEMGRHTGRVIFSALLKSLVMIKRLTLKSMSRSYNRRFL